MLSRRDLLAAGGLAALGGLTGGCSGLRPELARAHVARGAPEPARVDAVVDAVGTFGADLLDAVGAPGNLVSSPYSVLVALAMVRNGATGKTARAMDATLHLPDLAELNAGLNALDQTLATRSGRRRTAEGTRAEVRLDLANRVWGQRDLTWEQPFLESMARSYGTGVGQVDFVADSEDARRRVNAWVADQTRDRITELMSRDSVDGDTRMVLTNALYVRAPWHEPFTPGSARPFQTPDGSQETPTIRVSLPRGGSVGRGWRAARIPLAGQQLALTVILPDGGLDDLARRLGRDGLVRLLRSTPDTPVAVSMPRFRIRSELDLVPVLSDLGMERAFEMRGEFDGLTRSEPLSLGAVRHQGWMVVDEHGLEAAAATGASVEAISGLAEPDLRLVLDRPFLACLHDVATALPLILSQVQDPAAAAA